MTTARRRPVKKPKGKEGLCWAWKRGHKKRGLAAEQAHNLDAAEACRCHRAPEVGAKRCYLHGGRSKTGKEHHSHKHGFYSRNYHGIMARAGEAEQSLEAATSSLQELALQRVLIDHKLGEINVAGPSDEVWVECKGLVQQINAARDARDHKAQAALLNRLFDTITRQGSSASARPRC